MNLINRIKKDLSDGVKRIFVSLNEGVSLFKNNIFLLFKYAFISSLIFIISSAFLENYLIPTTGILLISLSYLFLHFHHELFNYPVKNKKRFIKNGLFLFIFLILIISFFYLGSIQEVDENTFNPGKIISSSLAFILLIFFFFVPIYLVRGGATFKNSVKSIFNFLGKYGMSAVFYIFVLIFMLLLSSLPGMLNLMLVPFSILLFFTSIYVEFILLYTFWKNKG